MRCQAVQGTSDSFRGGFFVTDFSGSEFERNSLSGTPQFDQGVIQHACLHGHLPYTFSLRIDFADAAFPVILRTGSVDPKGVDIDYRKGAIALFGNLDFLDLSLVVSQAMSVE